MKNIRDLGKHRNIKITIEDTDLLGIRVTVTGLTKRHPDVEIDIMDYVKRNVAYDVDGLELTLRFIGDFSKLPRGTRIVIRSKSQS